MKIIKAFSCPTFNLYLKMPCFVSLMNIFFNIIKLDKKLLVPSSMATFDELAVDFVSDKHFDHHAAG